MKHLKKYKVFGSPLMRYLGKEELDEMSQSDIDDYESEIIQRNRLDSDFDQYLNELDLYYELRFEYSKNFMKKLLKNHDPNRISRTTDEQAEDLLVSVMNREGGFDELYRLDIEQRRAKVGTPKFIIGII